MKIAYCIGSLAKSRGVERVLVNKANFLAEHFNLEAHIFIADQGTLPEIVMPQWIALFKELQHE